VECRGVDRAGPGARICVAPLGPTCPAEQVNGPPGAFALTPTGGHPLGALGVSRKHTGWPQTDRDAEEQRMIILGLILLVLDVGVLWTIGIVLLVVGAVLFLLGSINRPVLGRRHYF